MTINYTTLLGLAKPVTGTESGDWGDVVNDQITSLVEDAIANAASISVTAGNVTLTDNNGTSDQARMAILLVTGSPGVSRNIVAPSTSKWYIVKNSSNAEVVLKGSATTGVTIPADAEVLAFWNGSDFEVISMVGPSTSTDNAVARFDGTTGKVVQNSAVTIADTSGDITTAGYVFTAAGAVGTPAYSTSGDTNTGIWFPAADTIAFSEGGVEVMRINSSGNVGIGTSSPNDKLTVAAASGDVYVTTNNSTVNMVSGISAGNVGLVGTTTNHALLLYANNAERMRVDTSGNVGIGTSASPGVRLEVRENTSCFSTVSTALNSFTVHVLDPGTGSPPGPGATTLASTSASLQIDASQLTALCVYNTDISSGFGQRDVYVAPTSGSLGYLSSLRGRKTNIESIADVSWLYELNPVSFYYKKQVGGVSTDEPEGFLQLGLIAEEVEQVRPELCFYDFVEGGPPELCGVSYSSLITPLLKAIQQLKEELVEAKARIAALELK